mgnify:CR=1 FL=1
MATSFYTPIAKEFSQTRHSPWPEFNLLLPYLKPNFKLLDLGCGNGRLYKFLKKHKKISYLGMDNNKRLLALAKKEKPSARFLFGDMTKIPSKSDSFDIIACVAAFHHLPSKKLRLQALSEMHRILKKNGVLFLTNWNLFQPKYKKYIWLSYLRLRPRDTFIPWSDSGIKRYYHAFTTKELSKLLQKSGFRIIHCEIGRNLVYICQKLSKS